MGCRFGFRVRACGVVVALSAGVVAMSASPGMAAQVTVEHMPLAGAWSESVGFMVNGQGDVAGSTNVGVGPYGAFLWDSQGLVDLQRLAGSNNMSARLSPTGAVTGRVGPDTGTSFVYSFDRVNGYRSGGTLGGFSATGVGFVDNQVVGTSTTLNGTPQAFRWDGSGPLVALGSLDGDRTEIRQVSRTGIAVGVSNTADGKTHLVRWVHLGAPEDLGSLGSFGQHQLPQVRLAGDNGSIFGYLDAATGAQAFSWTPAANRLTITPMPTDPPLIWVNERGQWTGTRCADSGIPFCYHYEVVRWEPGGALETLPTGTDNALVTSINDKGQIIGTRSPYTASAQHFLWDPTCGLTDLPGDPETSVTMLSNNGYVTGGYRIPTGGHAAYRMKVNLEPCAPTPVVTAGAGTATFTWSAPNGRDAPVAAYRVYRDDTLIQALDPSVTGWQDNSSSAGSHRYAVSAVNSFGESNKNQLVVDVPPPNSGSPADVLPSGAFTGTPTAQPVVALPAFTG